MRMLLLALTGVLTIVGHVDGQAARRGSAPQYDVVVANTVRIPMRDGVRLAADIYFPAKDGVARDGKWPTILEKIPYGRAPAAREGRYFASRGYVFVMVDCRGANDSEGTLYFYVNDSKDGYDVVEWIARQPWSNGAVGTYGVSHGALSQYATALARPPALKAQFLVEGPDDYHDGGGAWNGGAWMVDHNLEHTIGRVLNVNNVSSRPDVRTRMEEARANYHSWLQVPSSRHFELFNDVPEAVHWYRDWLTHPDYDEYWKQIGFNLREHVQKYPDIPLFFLGGWYDHLQRPFLRGYTALKTTVRSPTKLIAGPWIHGGGNVGRSSNGETEYGKDAALDLFAIVDRWMAKWLKGTETGVVDDPPVRIFVMGTGDGHKTPDGKLFHGGYWRDEEQWPLARAKPTRYYLHPDGGLNTQVPPATAPPSGYASDPQHPVPTIFTRQGGGWDQRCRKESPQCDNTLPLAARPDVLVFRSATLRENVEATGPVTVTLSVSSDAPDTDVAVKLIDEYPPTADFPNGFALILVDGLRRGRYRNSLEKAEFMEPGRIYQFAFELPPTSNVFKKGHRVRIDVSSSNFPKFDVNPNTGEPIQFHTRTRIAHNQVYHDQQHQSFIELPIVTSATVPTAMQRGDRHE